MDAVTYPDKNVTEFIKQNFIPLRVLTDSIPLSTDFNVQGAPTLILLDKSGKEHYRAVGFIPIEEMIPLLLFGIAKTYFDLNQFDQAIQKLDVIISEHPKSYTAPEATYLWGVYGYKSTHDRRHLRQAYEKLRHGYKHKVWTIRILPLVKSIITLLVSYLWKRNYL
ncbi:MAG TPA: hypothetical protein VMT12_09170 [Syntrophales bacterium]|nr:hypothetical protein [Syntrophales bacterium]